MKLWEIFRASSATIFDYARGVHRYTRQQQKDIDEIREGQRQEGFELPHGDKGRPDDDKHGDGR